MFVFNEKDRSHMTPSRVDGIIESTKVGRHLGGRLKDSRFIVFDFSHELLLSFSCFVDSHITMTMCLQKDCLHKPSFGCGQAHISVGAQTVTIIKFSLFFFSFLFGVCSTSCFSALLKCNKNFSQ